MINKNGGRLLLGLLVLACIAILSLLIGPFVEKELQTAGVELNLFLAGSFLFILSSWPYFRDIFNRH